MDNYKNSKNKINYKSNNKSKHYKYWIFFIIFITILMIGLISRCYNNKFNKNIVDSKGYLISTNDETDRSEDILNLLQTGYCHLGEGIFYVDDKIEMPKNSTLIGCGNSTILKLSKNNQNPIVTATEYCTIRNLQMVGNTEQPSDKIGKEIGILIYDTKTDFTDEGSIGSRSYAKNLIDGITFNNLNGSGIEIKNTGGSACDGSIITNCRFDFCSVGINFSRFTEYHKVSNCIIGPTNYIGVLNNGGNNSFVNCTIAGSNSGFVIDNSDGTLINEGHGICNGCTFNHIGSNKGDSIKIIGNNNGFIFSGCEWWFGTIKIENSIGVVFNGIQGGGNTNKLVLNNNLGIVFDCMQLNCTPEIIDNNNTNLKFNECYNYKTDIPISH